MTRDEAIKAYADAAHDSRLEYYDETRRKAELAIKCLEALGLIKFDEPKIDDAAIRSKAIDALRKLGYNQVTVLK